MTVCAPVACATSLNLLSENQFACLEEKFSTQALLCTDNSTDSETSNEHIYQVAMTLTTVGARVSSHSEQNLETETVILFTRERGKIQFEQLEGPVVGVSIFLLEAATQTLEIASHHPCSTSSFFARADSVHWNLTRNDVTHNKSNPDGTWPENKSFFGRSNSLHVAQWFSSHQTDSLRL